MFHVPCCARHWHPEAMNVILLQWGSQLNGDTCPSVSSLLSPGLLGGGGSPAESQGPGRNQPGREGRGQDGRGDCRHNTKAGVRGHGLLGEGVWGSLMLQDSEMCPLRGCYLCSSCHASSWGHGRSLWTGLPAWSLSVSILLHSHQPDDVTDKCI